MHLKRTLASLSTQEREAHLLLWYSLLFCGIVCYASVSAWHCDLTAPIGGLSLLNEDGDLRVFFPRNSFVTNTTLTHTNSPRHSGGVVGNDHMVCDGGSTTTLQVTWHNSNGAQLEACATPCMDCGGRCIRNGAVGVDPQDGVHTDIHMFTDSNGYVNQDLECQVSSGPSAFIGVYLKNGGEFA